MDDDLVARDPWRGVHNAIRASILSGEYEPGSRLVEQHLADRYKTSRGPVRTALQELERSGLVFSIDRRGTFVRVLSDTDIEEINSLATLLFEFAIRRAIVRIGSQEREMLLELDARLPAESDTDAFLGYAIEFGRLLFRIADHSRALEIYENLLIQTQARSLFAFAAGQGLLSWAEARQGLRDISQALVQGDLEAALTASNAWISPFEEWIEERQQSAASHATE